MRQRDSIDCLIPRGGPSLIASILEHATVPYVIDGDGNCHVYVDAVGRPRHGRAPSSSTPRPSGPSVCNAAETLLVHRGGAPTRSCPTLAAGARRRRAGRRRARPGRSLPGGGAATDDDWATEFLDLKLAVRVVDSLDDAIDHISRYGSGHSEAIVTRDLAAADRFTREVDAAAVLVNASTRFVDGEEFGFGAEIGISTQKLHARGPDGPARADHGQVRGPRRRPDPRLIARGRGGRIGERALGPAPAHERHLDGVGLDADRR